MKEHDFDKIIGGKLRDYSKQPPDELFSRIEKSLAEGGAVIQATAAKRRRMTPLWRYAGIAALFCALLATSLYLRNTYHNEPEAHMANTVVTKAPSVMLEGIQQPEVAEIYSERQVGETAMRKNIAAYGQADNLVKETIAKDTVLQKDINGSLAEELSQQSETVVKEPRHQSRRPYNSNIRHRVDEYWDNLLAAEAPARRREKAAISIFAGNVGVGSGASTSDPDKAVAYGMLLKEHPGSGTGKPAGILTGEGLSSAAPIESNVNDISLKHYMPLNAGLSISIPLADAVTLNTGINYSYLFSSSTQSFTAGVEGRTTRELHYVGIPLGVSYKFFSKKGFNFYVYGGGAVEKAVAWRETYRFSNSVDSGKEIINRSVKGVQLSVNASAGVSYDIARNISLYLEPGVAYYFHQKDQPASYRTAHPTSFSLRLGFRFGI